MLELQHIEKSYGGRTILSIPGIGLDTGIYWLKGSNGAGKTTLLRMIAGLMPFKGDIVLKGHSLRREPLNYRQQVSWADAEPLFPEFIKGSELVAFYAGVRKAEAKQVDALTELFAIRSWLPAPVGTYSSGMVKKLSLVLAFIGRPALIALDEPLVTLDADSVPILYDLIAKTYREQQTGFLISSHQELSASALPWEKTLLVKDQSLQIIA